MKRSTFYVITHYYPPVVNPPANRMDHLVRMLVETYGADRVRVITGRPNHPHGKLPPEFRWRLFKRRTGRHGETIHHLYEYPAPNEGFFRKTWGYVTFAGCLFVRLLFLRFRKDDVLFVTTPPVFTAYAVHLAACLRPGLKYILDVRDLWPQAIAGIGFIREGSWIYRFFCQWSDWVYRRAEQLIGNSQGIVEHLADVSGCENKRIALIHNPVDTDQIKPLSPDERRVFRAEHAELFGDGKRPVFLYAGMHSIYTDLMTLVRSLKLVRARTDRFIFILIGYGEQKEELRQYVHENGLADNVKFLDFMPKAELINYISAADYGYVSLKDTPTLRYAIPSKTLEYLACGKPVLAALAGPFAEMIAREEVARVTPPGQTNDLASEVCSLIRRPVKMDSDHAQNFITERFSPESFRIAMRQSFSMFPCEDS